jgi:hypothetical protein
MNERIRELAEQAQEYAGQQIDEGANWDDAPIYYTEKLAELIVRECAKSLWTEECHNSDLALEEFERNSAKIKERFGVEE